MSIPRKFDVNCPKCGKKYQATVFESLNSDFAPNVAETIINGERFIGTCPKCGFVAHLEYDVLYHDMKHGAMVWVIHKNNTNYAQKVEEVRSIPLQMYKTTRIVSDMNELREKVACLESEKDDRVVELCKFFLSAQLMEQQPDFRFRNAFFTYSNGKGIVFFYDDNGKEMSCYLDDQIYDLVNNMFTAPLCQMDNTPYKIIDQDWAANFFELLPTESEELSEGQEQETDEGVLYPEVSESVACENSEEYSEEVSYPSEDTSEQLPVKRTLFCRKCGARLLSDSLFCSYCGTKVIF